MTDDEYDRMVDEERLSTISRLEAECHQRSSETSRIAARCDRMGEERDAARRQVTDLKAEWDGLRQRLADFEDDFCRVLADQCAPDEMHCSCVPHLRRALAEAVPAFVARVNARAEADMLAGRPITGAHHRALVAELALLAPPAAETEGDTT